MVDTAKPCLINRISNKLKQLNNDRWVILVIILLAIFYSWGILKVPFHPDESTQIYMSKDFHILVSNPSSLIFSPDEPYTKEGNYRAIDAPLTRYVIGLGRLSFNVPELSSDWVWEKGWYENLNIGSIPTEKQLLISRLAVSIFLPFTLIAFYFSFRKLLPIALSIIAVIFLGLHPLVLLHARRAMAESLLLFGISLFMWSITREKIQPWLIGITMAIAVNAKQSAIALVPVGIIAVCIIPRHNRYLKKMLARILESLSIFFILCYVLNPFFWKYPVSALQTSFDLRQNLAQGQVTTHLVVAELNPIEKLFYSVSNIYINPPSTYEVSSYLKETEDTIIEYYSHPLHVWGRGKIAGSILFSFTLTGIFVLIKSFPSFSTHKKILSVLFALSSILLFTVNVIVIPIPWQRYVVSLVPFVAFWLSFSLSPFFQSTLNSSSNQNKNNNLNT